MVVSIVDGPAMDWINGMDAYEKMDAEFRRNLGGDDETLRGLLAKFWLRPLWVDPVTTRRIDHIRTEPGYLDLSEAYHDSVEEGFFRGGDCVLSAEGLQSRGDYFWRPPGWVHKAWSTHGFDTILCMEGEVASEESGRVSRIICADHEAGHQARDGEEGGIGPRGYVRHAESRYMPWSPIDGNAAGFEPSPLLAGKVLSSNVDTDACSVLVRASAGWSGSISAVARERFVVNTTGSVTADGQLLGDCSLIHIPAGDAGPAMSVSEDVELLVKVCEAR